MGVLKPNFRLSAKLGEAVSSNSVFVSFAFRLRGNDGSLIPDVGYVSINGTTETDIIIDPANDFQILVDSLIAYNNDSISHSLTFYLNDRDNSSYIPIYSEVLESGETLSFSRSFGWQKSGGLYRSIKSFTMHGDASANFPMTNATQAERLAGNTSRHIFMVDLEGYTQVRLRSNKQVGSASANTPLFRAKYYSSFTTTVGNFLQLGLSAQVEFSVVSTGYVDTGWMDLALGARINGCCIGFTELGGDGVADPALGATDILFR